MLVRTFGLREGSAGAGKFSGGEGAIRELEFLEPLQVSILSEVPEFVPIGLVKSNPSSQRRTRAPYGLEGGGQGGLGRNIWIKQAREEDGDVTVDDIPNAREINIGGKATIRMGKGDRLRIETPGGGGWGLPGEEGGIQSDGLKYDKRWEARGSLAEREVTQASF